MKPYPQDRTALGDISSPHLYGGAQRDAPPRPDPGAAGASHAALASGAAAPVVILGRGLLALPLIVLGLLACWLATAHDDSTLRGVLFGGGVVLALLLPLTIYARRQARERVGEAASARRQLTNILGSVHEGLFLIGRDLRLSAIGSASMRELLRLGTPAGRLFEEVLRTLLVDEETLTAAVTFLQLLWAERADEHAIESLNPLNQVEVSFANSRGGSERRILSFTFRRVGGTRRADDFILGTVNDVTDRVLLTRELEQAQVDADSQADLLLQLVRTDPVVLVGFLNDADDAFRRCNAILSASGIGQPQLHRKLMGVLQELDALTVASEALPLASFTERLRGIDAVLSQLCTRAELIGNDFLPAVVRLDELMSHAATMRAIHQHIVLLRAASAALAALDERAASGAQMPVAPMAAVTSMAATQLAPAAPSEGVVPMMVRSR